MAVGTAGFTAMLAVMALERHGLRPGDGEVLVTGAAGGVGSVATALLSRLGHRVVAATGRPELRDYLTGLGAAELIERAALAAAPSRLLDRERWAGALDAVGGATHSDDFDAAQIRRQRRGLWARRWQRSPDHRPSLPAARREPARDRSGHHARAKNASSLAAAGLRSAARSARP